MSSGDSLADEIVVLQSVFDDNFRNEGSSITITLFPLQENEKKENFVQVDLCLECSDAYPEM